MPELEGKQRAKAYNMLVKYVLDNREDRAFASRVARGLVPSTERMAYADVMPFVEFDSQAKPFLRIAALIAANPKIDIFNREMDKTDDSRKTAYKSVGESFMDITMRRATRTGAKFEGIDPAKPDSVASRLHSLASRSLDEAVLEINRLLQLGSDLDIEVDWYALAEKLVNWESLRPNRRSGLLMRDTILAEYYRAGVIANLQSSSEGKSAGKKA